MGERTASKSAVEVAANAASWVHQLSGLPPVSESPFVRATLAGLQRKLAKPKEKKEHVMPDLLNALVESLTPTPSLGDLCLVASSLLAFTAFLRYDELAKLCCCDLSFSATSMCIHIISSKMDQYCKGDSVLVARSGTSTCPVAMMERYVVMACINLRSELCLFCGITRGERLRASGASGALNYTRMR